MKVVSIINYKGGVGKTTLSANLVAGITLFSSRPEYADPVILQGHSAGTYAGIVSELKALQAEFEQKAGI